jgi:hypothetical protein
MGETKDEQPSPINITELGILRDNKDEHPEKHQFPRNVTEFGIISAVNDDHPLK